MLKIPGLSAPVAEKNLELLVAGSGSVWGTTSNLRNVRGCSPVVDVNGRAGCIFNDVVRIDPNSDRVTAEIPYSGSDDIAYGDGALWGIGSGLSPGRYLTEIDPTTNRVGRSELLASPYLYPADTGYAIAAGGGYVFVGFEQNSCSHVDKIDAASGALVATWSGLPCHAQIEEMALTNGLLWVGVNSSLIALRTSTGARQYLVNTPIQITSLAASNDSIWAAGGGLVQVDPRSGRIERYERDSAVALTWRVGELWTAQIVDTMSYPSSELHDEISLAEIDPSSGRTTRRIFEPDLSGFWFDLAAGHGGIVLIVSSGTASSSQAVVVGP